MKRNFLITISNRQKDDSFMLQAESAKEAISIAHIAHIGTGWDVVQAKAKK